MAAATMVRTMMRMMIVRRSEVHREASAQKGLGKMV
jgi:hypothetical protein